MDRPPGGRVQPGSPFEASRFNLAGRVAWVNEGFHSYISYEDCRTTIIHTLSSERLEPPSGGSWPATPLEPEVPPQPPRRGFSVAASANGFG